MSKVVRHPQGGRLSIWPKGIINFVVLIVVNVNVAENLNNDIMVDLELEQLHHRTSDKEYEHLHRRGLESNESARSKTLPLNMPLRELEAAAALAPPPVGTVACAAGPRAALRGVAGSGLMYGLALEPPLWL